jgi:hypothetical protein
MSVNPWDEFPNPTGDFVEFNNVGDEFAGVIKSIGVKVWDDGKKSPQLVCAPDGGGEDMTLTVSWVMLLSAFKKEAPNVGDHIRVKWIAVGPKPKETREWSLVVTRGGQVPPTAQANAAPAQPVAASAPSAPVQADSAGAADPLASLSPEQRAAIAALSGGQTAAPAWDTDPRVAPLRAMGIADDAIRTTLGI